VVPVDASAAGPGQAHGGSAAFSARISVYQGDSLDTLTEVAAASTPTGAPTVAFRATGTAYMVQIDGGDESSGPFTLRWGFRTRPNVVFILTDDQRWDEMDYMPTVDSQLASHGVEFTNAYVVNPACCPSRTSILTGRYSHGTDVYGNHPPHGGFGTFTNTGEDASTIATWLQGAGYRTALVGKYLNGYGTAAVPYVPPGWDVWDALALATTKQGDTADGYYDYAMSLDGSLRTYGSSPSDYSTTVLTGYARQVVATTPDDQPLFLEFAPRAPHDPATPAPEYAKSLGRAPPVRSPSWNEADVSDKPSYIQRLAPLTSRQLKSVDKFRLNQLRALRSVDDAVGQLLADLRHDGRLSNTLVMFMSDNGLEAAEHRWTSKYLPYEEDIRVPMVMRYDAATPAPGEATSSAIALNIDIAPTIADLAAISTPPMDGRSLLPALSGGEPTPRDAFLVEHAGGKRVPSFCAIHTNDWEYVEYATDERELYDMQNDPYELENRAGNPSYSATQADLAARLETLCTPRPPGFP